MQSCKYISECSWAGGSGRVEQKMVPSLPLLSFASSVSVKENPDRGQPLRMSAPKWEEGAQPKEYSCGQEWKGQPNVDVHIEKKIFFSFFIIVWKYFLSNINSIFECSVLDKIRLDYKVYPSPTHLLHVLPVYRRSKNYFLICQSIVIWWVTSLNEFHRISP